MSQYNRFTHTRIQLDGLMVVLSLSPGLIAWVADLQATNASIRVLKVCGPEDHSIVLRRILEVDYCNVTLPGWVIHSVTYRYVTCTC